MGVGLDGVAHLLTGRVGLWVELGRRRDGLPEALPASRTSAWAHVQTSHPFSARPSVGPDDRGSHRPCLEP